MAENTEPTDFAGIVFPQTQDGATNKDAVWNPGKYTANVNNPLAKGLIQAYGGLKGAQGINPLSGGYGDIQAILGGAVGGLQANQQMQEQAMMMAPIEEVSPGIVEAIPAAKGIPFQQFMQLKDVFSAMAKKSTAAEDMFGPEDIDYIKSYLRGKKYSEEDINTMAPQFVGRSLSQLKAIAPTERLARQDIESKVKLNDFGIPVAVEQFDKISNKTTIQPLKENAAITQQIQKIASGKNMVDILYKKYKTNLSPEQQKAFAETLNEGYENSAFIEGGEQGFVQRFRGVVARALAKPAFGGREGEKLRAFQTALEANIPMIARSLGHTGVLTELDVMKSFGIAPDITGTALENVERQNIYNDLTKAQVDSIMGSYVPYYGERPDMDKLYKRIGIVNTSTPVKQQPKPANKEVIDGEEWVKTPNGWVKK